MDPTAMMIEYGISGNDYDFNCFNSAGEVWNGSAFVAWSDVDFLTYRVAATEAGASSRFSATAPAGTISWEMRFRGATLADSYVAAADIDQLAAFKADAQLGTAAGGLLANAAQVLNVPRAAAPVTAGAPQQRHLENSLGATLQSVREVFDGDAS